MNSICNFLFSEVKSHQVQMSESFLDTVYSDDSNPVEEYASIQEFPQDWKICGSILDQYKQIGNAVPIKLGEAIGRAILDDMNGNKYVIFNFPFSRYKLTDEISWEKEIRNAL